MLLNILVLFSAFAFLYYGYTFFINSGMKEEFERYGLDRFRKLVGWLQLLGGAGLLAGFLWHPILIIASGGLSILMMIGFAVRIKMKDGFWESMPSVIFSLLNCYICLAVMFL